MSKQIHFIKDDVSDRDKAICEKYWYFENESSYLPYSVKEIGEEFELTVPKVTSLVKDNCELVQCCNRCSITLEVYKMRSEMYENDELIIKSEVCETCSIKIKKEKRAALINQKLNELSESTQLEKWRLLTIRELKMLIIILESSGYRDAYRKLFCGFSNESEHVKNIWNRLKNIEAKGLIWTERDENNKVVDIYTDQNLLPHLHKKAPQLFDYLNLNESGILKIKIHKNGLKANNKQPDYISSFLVGEDTRLKPGVFYSIAGWECEDDSINLVIKVEE